VKALQNKQRSGNVAPPTTPYTPSPASLVLGTNRAPLMEVPDFTPLGRRAPPPSQRRPVFPSLVIEDGPFANLPKQEGVARKLPASLLAPRYSHLLEEAVAVSQLGAKVPETSIAGVEKDPDVSVGEDAAVVIISSTPVDDEDAPPPLTTNETNNVPATPASIGKRVKGLLFSYLPTLSKTAPPALGKIKRSHQAGLPLPPPEVLEKPRGPISTPVRQPLPKSKPPKELVHLNPAPQPQPRASMIPRSKKPQRLVKLQPLLPQSPLKPVARPRRSSGGSVKDLVRSFEDLEQHREVEKAGVKKLELKRVKSNGDWRTVAGMASKPGWRP
jgi:hypothetical protein